MKLAEIENVVRVIFPLTMMREGELLPAAFRLREKKDGAEQYLSVFRQFASTFHFMKTSFNLIKDAIYLAV